MLKISTSAESSEIKPCLYKSIQKKLNKLARTAGICKVFLNFVP